MLQPKMTKLRVVAFVTITGGLVAAGRFAQALSRELSFDGSHELSGTIPLFAVVALVSIGLVWSGALFLKRPTRQHAVWVSQACVVSLWVVLAGTNIPAGLVVCAIGLTYLVFLRPAVVSEFGGGAR